eukprot:3666398-Pleurochrysis_carterae.AAC.1
MAEPARTTGSGLAHHPTIPVAVEEARAHRGTRRTGGRGGRAYAPCRGAGFIGLTPSTASSEGHRGEAGGVGIDGLRPDTLTQSLERGVSQPSRGRGAGGPARDPEVDQEAQGRRLGTQAQKGDFISFELR